MFLPQGQGTAWTFNTEARGRLKGRLQRVKAGYFILEHIATGKVFIGQAGDCSAEVDLNIQAILQGNHPCKALVRLYESDTEFKVHEYPSTTVKEAKRVSGLVKNSVQPRYLMLN